MSKESLRQSRKAARLSLSRSEVEDKSQAITENLKLAVDWRQISNLHCFLPIAELNEVDTRGLLEFIWAEFPNIVTYTSPKSKDEWRVERINPGFTKTSATETPKFDVVVVPMLGFDEKLHRLGYGGGNYDRFLASQPQARKIGVCFELGRLESIPSEPHDIMLDQVVTEKGTG
ncbi:MAG TPA: 5-formyltetrahydrofolate cyclo-ligase [Candidatus Saccharimonadales bacterium]|nr:5-formyltetrahydrofolate cyclo-ligase [Candidatus Saccharimonadales bacterium]